jgi:hypothetical protein
VPARADGLGVESQLRVAMRAAQESWQHAAA